MGALVALSAGTVSSSHANPSGSVHQLAEAAWPYMTAEQKQLVDIVARDLYEATSPEQKHRISGSRSGRYEALPDWRKAPFRGNALRQLGHDTNDFVRSAV